MMKNLIVVVLLAISSSGFTLTVSCGHLFDSEQGQFVENQVIEIDQGEVVSVADINDQTIDLNMSDGYCLPGLIDTHTHLSSQMGPDSYIKKFTLNAADVTLNAVRYADRTLQAGFTTVRDLGDSFGVTVALRDAIKAGKVSGPRIFTSGKSLATTGGHADPSNGYRDGLHPPTTPGDGVINGVDEARRAVRLHYQDGADLIKITATGGVLSQASSGDNSQFAEDELEAIIDIAQDYGFKVAAHAHGQAGMKRAIEAGVDSIEHGSYLDDEIVKLMKKHDTYLVPTLMAGAFVTEKAKEDGYFPPMVAQKAATIGPIMGAAFKRAYDGGVKIAFGTDSGVSEHGRNADEFALMVAQGMSPTEAIMAATRTAAELIGDDKIGVIKRGSYADMVVVKNNPLDDIQILTDIPVVIKGGQIVKNEY
ncbi:metal-dependent hydrolase family protein [Marinicella gelatinilytica]|uniref:metal-dependent hydrolase family protein n=1 Tax=Marinicella gelatinilytica TaxID=2996017 RepID=UPI002260E59A|nr:amidohydrolase family protein [Marinicella gelatinilytica]MCX7544871.1 amidohydrolase family protein [Marinicella gelatinilytica]